MKNNMVKIYQSNKVNLIMQLDTKRSKLHNEDFYAPHYRVGKGDNTELFFVFPPIKYCGNLTMDDFVFSGTTHRLFMYIRELYAMRNTQNIDFSIKEYMLRCGLSDRKQARKQIEKDLFALSAVRYADGGTIIDSFEMLYGRISVLLSTDFIADMSRENYILLPLEYYTIDRQQFTYAPSLLYYLILLKYYNSKKTNKNRITIKSLLEYGKFPSIEEVRKTKNNSIKGRIIVPFFRNLNALNGVARYTYYSERGERLTPDEVRALPYEDMIRVVIHIEWLYDKKK